MTAAQLQTLGGERLVSPILFRKYLQQAIRVGAKDTTRRIVTAKNSLVIPGTFEGLDLQSARGGRLPGEIRARCTFPSGRVRTVTVLPKASYGDVWWVRPGRFGMRRASELTLTLKDIQASRVQDMTDTDALREGVEFIPERLRMRGTPRDWFGRLWDDIYGRGAWERNDWVYAVRFACSAVNVDSYLRGRLHVAQ